MPHGHNGPMTGYLAPSFAPMAHRGGALLPSNLGIENTVAAFRNAVDLGFDYLETDIHATSDGQLVAFHDPDLTRVTDLAGTIEQLPLSELRRIKVSGREPIPTLDELFESFPSTRFNLDIKAPKATTPLARLISHHGAGDRVCVGSFSQSRIRKFRKLAPSVQTAHSPVGSATLAFSIAGRSSTRPKPVYQVPISHQVAGFRVNLVTPTSVKAVHSAGARIHVWTIDDPLVMHKLIDWGVDGIISDRPDLLKEVLRERGMWSTREGT